jgi:hypothetical protein
MIPQLPTNRSFLSCAALSAALLSACHGDFGGTEGRVAQPVLTEVDICGTEGCAGVVAGESASSPTTSVT